MLAASSAAFTAPALPIASVPTGMPPGICAMERSESRPFSAFDSTGTPSTGNTLFDAVIPGRCAAPPAPAMITSIPRFSAPAAYSNSKSGVRCAETTRISCGTPSSSSVFAACSIVSQSDDEPMMIPTNGCRESTVRCSIDFLQDRRLRDWRKTSSERAILRFFSTGRDLLAISPVETQLPDQIERAGHEYRVMCLGSRERFFECRLRFGDHVKFRRMVCRDFPQLRHGNRARRSRLRQYDFSGEGEQDSRNLVDGLVSKGAKYQPHFT